MKRTNDTSQLSKEEYDALNDRDDDDSPLKYGIPKASKEELAGRRVVTAKKRPSTNDTSTEQPAVNAFANFGKSPFAAVSLVAPSTTFPTQTQPEQAANPFRGMNHLTLPQTSITAAASSSSNAFNVPMPAKEAPKPVTETNSEYNKQMKKLNDSFFHWAERQVKDNAIALWKDGVKDYLKHQQTIAEKYPVTAIAATTVGSSASTTLAAPVSSLPSTVTFAWPPALVSATVATTSSTSGGLLGNTSAPVAAAAFPPPAPSSSASATSTMAFKPFTMSSTGAFSMGAASTAPSSTATAAAPLFPAFNLPSAANPPPAAGSGSGLFFPTTIGASTATTGSSMFASSLSVPSSSAPAAAGGDDADGGEGGGGDEGEPILAPEKVLRNENDKDTILFEAAAKLFNFNTELKEWRDTGKGTFRLTEDPTTQKKRMVMRNGTGKITLNAAFYKGFKLERTKGGLKFSAFVAKEEGSSATEFKGFLLKLNDENAERVRMLMEKIASEMK